MCLDQVPAQVNVRALALKSHRSGLEPGQGEPNLAGCVTVQVWLIQSWCHVETRKPLGDIVKRLLYTNSLRFYY